MTYTMRRFEAQGRLDHICKDFWRRFESNEEHAERIEVAQVNAARFFHGATTAQKAALDETLALWRWDYSPRAERHHDAAKRDYEATTAEAFDLYVVSVEDILRG